MQQVFEVLKATGIDNQTVLKEKETLILQKRPEVELIKQTGTRYVNGIVSRTATMAKFKQAEQKILQAKIPGARLFIESAVGYPFAHFTEMHHLLDEGISELKHENEEVLLVCMWATWSKGSLSPMQRIHQMLEANGSEWGNSVRVVAVNVDEKKDEATTFITEKGWTRMQHLTTNGWDKKKSPLLQYFAVEGVPFLVLVDKFGKVDYEGGSNHAHFQGRILQLLAQQVEEQYPKPKVEVVNYRQDFEKSELQLRELLVPQKFGEIFADSEMLCSRLIVQSIAVKGVISKQFLLEVFLYENDIEALRKVKYQFETIEGVEVKVTQVKYIQVPEVQQPSCWQCQTSLVFPYYWLKWEEGTKFGCIDCVHKPSEQPNHHYSYQKNSILLTGKWKRIPLKGLGNNLQPEDILQFTKIHEFACNACEGGSALGQARYICLGCRAEPNFNYDYVDFCQSCIVRLEQESVCKCFQKEMHSSNHPWLRVLYQAGSYQRF